MKRLARLRAALGEIAAQIKSHFSGQGDARVVEMVAPECGFRYPWPEGTTLIAGRDNFGNHSLTAHLPGAPTGRLPNGITVTTYGRSAARCERRAWEVHQADTDWHAYQEVMARAHNHHLTKE